MSRHLQYQRLHHSHALDLRNSGSCSHSSCSHALIHNETGEITDNCHSNQWRQRKGIYHSKYLALGTNISKNNNKI
jgi:hypothetical protein